VGGLLAIGVVLAVAFVWIESRAAEPIVPLGLFRNRTYSASIAATFFASIGFFGAIIFIPRFFQFVRGASATESGYQVMPLLIGLIGSSIIAGQVVSRTGRYKAVVVGGVAAMAVGLALMTGLRAETDLPALWLWMFIIGVGVGPTLSVFTIIVQNAVPFQALGVATSNLTFFRQIGGTIGLAIAGTVFGDTLRQQVPTQLVASGVPQQFVTQFANGTALNTNDIAGVGGDLGARILAGVPAQFHAAVEPQIPAIVHGIKEAFTISIADTFYLGVAAAIVAVLVSFLIREIPLRQVSGATQPALPEQARPEPAFVAVEAD
jgi:Na+/melibiose symporter-like transporter